MKTFNIEIQETLSRTLKVKSSSLKDALIKIQELHRNEKIVLDEADFIDVEIKEVDSNTSTPSKI